MADLSAGSGSSGGPGTQGPQGEHGDFIYLAFASDDAGTDFTLTDSNALGYFAIIRSATEIETPVLADFASAVWYARRGADGDPGASVLNGTVNPAVEVGSDGDFYINTNTWQIFGPKSDGAWGSGSSLVGPTGLTGADGESIQGPAGADGATIHYGAGSPANGTGADGDSYLDTTNKVFYPNKTAGAWGAGFSMIGPVVNGTDGVDGSTILYGSGAPLNGQGANGDSYLDTTGMVFYANKTAGTWPSGVNLVGGTGATGAQGNAAGLPYLFGASTGNADPTAGKIRFDSATLASITTMRINKTDNVTGDRSSLIEAIRANEIVDLQSQSNTGTTFMRLKVTGTVPAIIASAYYNVPVSWVNGALPASNEPIAIRFQPGANMTYNSATKEVLDSSGVVISNPLSYNTLALAETEGATALNSKVFVVKSPANTAGSSPSPYYSDGTDIVPFGVQVLYDRLVGAQPKIIWPNTGITWTAANNGSGKVRLTSSGVHGLTTTPAVGCYLSRTNAPANWTGGAGTLHQIATIVSTTEIDLTTDYVASMGVPTFALVNTAVTAATFTLPKLRQYSEAIFDGSIFTNAGTCNRTIDAILDATSMQTNVYTNATNINVPIRMGFRNVSATNVQEGLFAINAAGYATSGTTFATAAVDTSVAGKIFKIS